jgi:transcriptional regulator with XRE-family HTH domain
VIGDRVKEVRQYLKLTQEEFGQQLGKSRFVVLNWEGGRSDLDDSDLNLIHRTLGVSKAWLEHGVGEMFGNPNAQLQAKVDLILQGEPSTRKAMIATVVSLPDQALEVFEKLLDALEKGRGL